MNPQAFNRYSYCLNNPLKYIDPSGHIVEVNGVDSRMLFDPNLIFVSGGGTITAAASSAEGQAHEAVRASNSEWVSQLEESSTVYEVALPVSSTSTTHTVEYVSDSLTYKLEIEIKSVANSDTTRQPWYVDINFCLGNIIGITGGIMINDKGLYPYFGGGIMTPSPGFPPTITASDSDPTPGWNLGIKGAFYFAGQEGFSISEKDNPTYGEAGYGAPGASLTVYYVWELLWSRTN